jgi:hypothetical protein
MSITDEITKLTEDWYLLIGKDHHKDRDCHWYIETAWSYGFKPEYIIRHYGYILDEIEEKCGSYEEALEKLKEILIHRIGEEKEAQAGEPTDPPD